MRGRAGILFGFLLLTLAGGFLAGQAVGPNLDWYATLPKPGFNPPAAVFAPVWTVLYVVMAVAAWRVAAVVRVRHGLRRRALGLWALQFALNFAWTFLFFGAHLAGAALIDLTLLWLVIVATIDAFARIDRAAAWLMAPYLAWVSFAGVLNGAIWLAM